MAGGRRSKIRDKPFLCRTDLRCIIIVLLAVTGSSSSKILPGSLQLPIPLEAGTTFLLPQHKKPGPINPTIYAREQFFNFIMKSQVKTETNLNKEFKDQSEENQQVANMHTAPCKGFCVHVDALSIQDTDMDNLSKNRDSNETIWDSSTLQSGKVNNDTFLTKWNNSTVPEDWWAAYQIPILVFSFGVLGVIAIAFVVVLLLRKQMHQRAKQENGSGSDGHDDNELMSGSCPCPSPNQGLVPEEQWICHPVMNLRNPFDGTTEEAVFIQPQDTAMELLAKPELVTQPEPVRKPESVTAFELPTISEVETKFELPTISEVETKFELPTITESPPTLEFPNTPAPGPEPGFQFPTTPGPALGSRFEFPTTPVPEPEPTLALPNTPAPGPGPRFQFPTTPGPGLGPKFEFPTTPGPGLGPKFEFPTTPGPGLGPKFEFPTTPGPGLGPKFEFPTTPGPGLGPKLELPTTSGPEAKFGFSTTPGPGLGHTFDFPTTTGPKTKYEFPIASGPEAKYEFPIASGPEAKFDIPATTGPEAKYEFPTSDIPAAVFELPALPALVMKPIKDGEKKPEGLKMKAKGLLERRGSSATLTIDLTQNTLDKPLSLFTPTEECNTEEILLSAANVLTRAKLRNAVKNVQDLHSEFWEIPLNHPEKSEVTGSGVKNRYETILPNERTRVKLETDSENPLDSYINANYIRGYNGEERAYIATQGPLSNTVRDLYHMVWTERCPMIVMITKLFEKSKIKCEPYVPTVLHEPQKYGDYEVRVISIKPKEGYNVRKLLVRKNSETRLVMHYWYDTWPDHKAPPNANTIVGLATEIEDLRLSLKNSACPELTDKYNIEYGPTVVHCSAGIGRTGCFIAICTGMNQLKAENRVDILGILCQMRYDRGGMIQTAEQYEFVHEALSVFSETLPDTGGI